MRTAIENWLSLHCAVVPGTAHGVVLLRRPEGLQPAAVWPRHAVLQPALAGAAQAAIGRQALVVNAAEAEIDGQRADVVAQPLAASGVLVGAVVLVVARGQPVSPEELTALATSAEHFSVALRAPAKIRADAGGAEGVAPQVLAIAQQAFDQADLHAGLTALLSSLATSCGADRAALGLREGVSTLVAATSAGPVAARDAAAQYDLAAAMDEVIDDGETLHHPLPENSLPRIQTAHARLVKAMALQAALSVPIVRGGAVLGALTLERSRAGAFTPAQIALAEGVARTVAAWIALQREAALPWRARWRSRARRAGERMAERGSGRWRLAALALGLALGSLVVVPTRHEISASARLEGTLQRVLSAPADGYLSQVRARPGDSVKAGQVLVEFNTDDLQLERTRLTAELSGSEAALGDALGKDDRSQLAVASAKLGETRAQLALVEQRLERAQVKAPFDGVVIQGDLSQALGAPVRKGDALVTLAPSNGYRAFVEVEDADIGLVRTGQNAALVLTAHPERVWRARVLRVTPLATQSEGRNVFEVEVALDAAGGALARAAGKDAPLRPGMRGVARLDVGELPLAVLWTRDAVAWLRLAAWRWVG